MIIRRNIKHSFDYVLLLTVMILCVFGLLMVFTSSMAAAPLDDKSPSYYFARQGTWLVIGLILMAVVAGVDYAAWRRFSGLLFLAAIALLSVVLLVGSVSPTGATTLLASGSIQPSEFAKLALVIFLARWLHRKTDDVHTLWYGLVPFAILVGIIAGLVLLQRDLGTAMIIVLTAAVVFLVAGADLMQFFTVGSLAGGIILVSAYYSDYQWDRIDRFWDPFGRVAEDVTATVRHVQHAIIALGSGGFSGLGLTQRREKWWGGLPVPYSDSIFGIIGEELGFCATVSVVLLFALLTYRGLKIALGTADPFARLLAVGITMWLVIQAAVNVGGNIALLPFTGVPLPFISYGGSSLVMCMWGAGILLSISRDTQHLSFASHGPPRGTRPGVVNDRGAGALYESHDIRRRNRWARVPGPVRNRGSAAALVHAGGRG